MKAVTENADADARPRARGRSVYVEDDKPPSAASDALSNAETNAAASSPSTSSSADDEPPRRRRTESQYISSAPDATPARPSSAPAPAAAAAAAAADDGPPRRRRTQSEYIPSEKASAEPSEPAAAHADVDSRPRVRGRSVYVEQDKPPPKRFEETPTPPPPIERAAGLSLSSDAGTELTEATAAASASDLAGWDWNSPIEAFFGTVRPPTEEERQLAAYAELFEANMKRGCSSAYSYDAVATFLRANNLKSVIRAHEVEPEVRVACRPAAPLLRRAFAPYSHKWIQHARVGSAGSAFDTRRWLW
jgi:hypothetical protein